jgi:fructose-bisphosphate aldolase class II
VPIIPTQMLVAEAVRLKRGIGAFNVIHLETAEALVAGAEQAGLPVILQISENCVDFHGSLRPIALATMAIAEQSTAEVAIHLDHATREALTFEAIDLGFGSVMYDGAHLEYDENVAATARVVERAHGSGVAVEAELGEIGGKDGAHAFGVRTDADDAVRFVAQTNVDSLAVAVGSSHAMTDRTAQLDTTLIAALRAAVPVPLVLHGSSGASDSMIQAAVRAGITKVNVSTHLAKAFTTALDEHRASNPRVVDSRKYVAAGRDAVASETARLLALIALGAEAQQ